MRPMIPRVAAIHDLSGFGRSFPPIRVGLMGTPSGTSPRIFLTLSGTGGSWGWSLTESTPAFWARPDRWNWCGN